MGRDEHFEGVYPREKSIQIGFTWNGQRHKERLALTPTPANLKAAARIRSDIVDAIRLDRFTRADFSRYFPDSKHIGSSGGSTFSAVADAWLAIVTPELAKTTVKEYTNLLERNFKPVFGDTPIAEISYEDLAVYMAGRDIKAAKTFNNIMTPVRRIWSYALDTGRVPVDITAKIKSRKGTKPAPDPLELDEIEAVLTHIAKKYSAQWHNYFEFAFFSGLRPSELIALKWAKIDFRRSKVRIDAARVRAVDKDTKTHNSRDIDLQTRALAALIRQKEHSFLNPAGYVFHNPFTNERLYDAGSPVQLVWRPTLKAIGLRDRDARQTRHSFATMCLHAGMNPAYISRQMGHTNPRMFFEVYSKWMDGEASNREISKLDALFEKPVGQSAGQ